MLNKDSLSGIRYGLRDSRRDGLTQFVREFMPVLLAENYTFEDLLYALANWASDQPRLDEVVNYLEKAIDDIHSSG